MKAGVGDGVDATCTSWQSNPPANLSWFINGEPVRTNKGKHTFMAGRQIYTMQWVAF